MEVNPKQAGDKGKRHIKVKANKKLDRQCTTKPNVPQQAQMCI